jgi:hypothetical protein
MKIKSPLATALAAPPASLGRPVRSDANATSRRIRRHCGNRRHQLRVGDPKHNLLGCIRPADLARGRLAQGAIRHIPAILRHIPSAQPARTRASVRNTLTLQKERTRKLQVHMGLAASTTARLLPTTGALARTPAYSTASHARARARHIASLRTAPHRITPHRISTPSCQHRNATSHPASQRHRTAFNPAAGKLPRARIAQRFVVRCRRQVRSLAPQHTALRRMRARARVTSHRSAPHRIALHRIASALHLASTVTQPLTLHRSGTALHLIRQPVSSRAPASPSASSCERPRASHRIAPHRTASHYTASHQHSILPAP